MKLVYQGRNRTADANLFKVGFTQSEAPLIRLIGNPSADVVEIRKQDGLDRADGPYAKQSLNDAIIVIDVG
jgi:hypothetical protein